MKTLRRGVPQTQGSGLRVFKEPNKPRKKPPGQGVTLGDLVGKLTITREADPEHWQTEAFWREVWSK